MRSPTNISPARMAAYEVLLRIETNRAFSSALLPIYEKGLSPIDAGLCHELTLGTLRRQLYLDRVIDDLSGARKVDVEVRIALRLGLYQLNNLTKIPPYSAINESVNLVARSRKRSAMGFANAILRRSMRETVEITFSDDVDRISVETSHPRWLVEKWVEALGVTETRAIAVANNSTPGTAFRVIHHDGDVERLLADSRPSDHAPGCYLTAKGALAINAASPRLGRKLIGCGCPWLKPATSAATSSAMIKSVELF